MMFVKKNQVQLPLNIAYHQMGKRGQGTTGLLCPKTEEEWLTMMTQVCDDQDGVGDQEHDDFGLIYGDVSGGDVMWTNKV